MITEITVGQAFQTEAWKHGVLTVDGDLVTDIDYAWDQYFVLTEDTVYESWPERELRFDGDVTQLIPLGRDLNAAETDFVNRVTAHMFPERDALATVLAAEEPRPEDADTERYTVIPNTDEMFELATSAHAMLHIVKRWLEGDDFGATKQSIYEAICTTLAEANPPAHQRLDYYDDSDVPARFGGGAS